MNKLQILFCNYLDLIKKIWYLSLKKLKIWLSRLTLKLIKVIIENDLEYNKNKYYIYILNQ